MCHSLPVASERRNPNHHTKMRTYALTLDNGKIAYITAPTRKQAVAIWTRANNEEIVSIKLCKEDRE